MSRLFHARHADIGLSTYLGLISLSDVKKLTNLITAIGYPTSSSNEAFYNASTYSGHVFHARKEMYGVTEGSNDEVGQVTAGTKFGSFLTPDMAFKKMPDAASGYTSYD